MRASSARRAARKAVEIVIEDGVEAWRQFALAGEAPHPDAVADQQMIERAVQRLEEGAAVGAVIGVATRRGGAS